MLECLTILRARLDDHCKRQGELQAHQMASRIIVQQVKTELLQDNWGKRVHSHDSTQPAHTALMLDKDQGVRSNRRRSSVTSNDEDIDASAQLFRLLGLTPPTKTSEEQTSNAASMEALLSERTMRLDNQTRALHATTEAHIFSHLDEARRTLQILRDSLLSETTYGRVRLLDADIEEAVGMFADEIRDLDAAIDGVDLRPLQVRNVDKERFIERWTRT